MPALTKAAALVLAAQCGIGQPPIPPEILAGLALGESGLQPRIVSPQNANGTFDRGVGQINDGTLALVGLTRETAMDPCQNMAGMARYLRILSGYHRGPGGPFDWPYVKARLADIQQVKSAASQPTETTTEPTLDDQILISSRHR